MHVQLQLTAQQLTWATALVLGRRKDRAAEEPARAKERIAAEFGAAAAGEEL